MTDCIISKYFNYKKNRLITYGKIIFSLVENEKFLTDCYEKYIKNYIEVYYYHIFSTVETKTSQITKELLKEEQTGIELEQLEELEAYELLDSNEVYEQKRQVVSLAKNICSFLIKLDRLKLLDKDEIANKLETLKKEEEEIKDLLTAEVMLKLQQSCKETIKTEQALLEENSIFSFKETKLTESLVQVNLTYYSKKLATNYKKTLVERVYQDNIVVEKKTILLLNKLVLKLLHALIYKEPLGHYIIEVEDSIFDNKVLVEEIFSLLNDKIVKEAITLGISYNQYCASKLITDKRKEKYSFACYQDFTYINDYNAKFANIENAQVFDYIIVTSYKDKEYEWLQKYTPVSVKEVLFSKEV